uniref:Uncharacterized protein n=1 Tax=Anopheles dirus TaxID=7168 RepID=A0A182NX05_9DIPT
MSIRTLSSLYASVVFAFGYDLVLCFGNMLVSLSLYDATRYLSIVVNSKINDTGLQKEINSIVTINDARFTPFVFSHLIAYVNVYH